jgi:hypothetical protein
MTTAYTSLLGLALPVTGELSGTWGDTVNNSITSLLDSAVAGTTTLSADTTLTTTTGAANQARQAILLCTGHSANITITAPAQSKIYTVINASATYTVKIRGAGPTTGITIPVSSTATVAWNGSDFVDASTYVNGNKVINGNLTVNGNTTLGDASGDTITINGTATFANVSPTLTAGTAGGVAYLSNPGKVLTTGSALTFNGQTLTNTTDTPILVLNDTAASNVALRMLSTGGVTYIQSGISLGAFSPIAFTSNGGSSEQMRLTSTSLYTASTINVGIGTSSPTQKLEILTATTSSTPAAIFRAPAGIGNSGGLAFYANDTNANARNWYFVSNSNAYGDFVIKVGASQGANPTTGTDVATFSSSGNLGLGVTPSTWGTNWKTYELGSSALSSINGFISFTSDMVVGSNAYYDGAWKYKGSFYATRYAQTTGQHQWYTSASGTAGNAITFIQAMTLNASGGLQTLNTVGVGNTTPSTSGAGITFPATQSSSSNVNTLDDYEEGTFTPTCALATPGTSATTSAAGFYTKVGNLVTVTGRLTFTKGTGSGDLTLGGLPFATTNTALYQSSGALSLDTFGVAGKVYYIILVSNSTAPILISVTQAGGAAAQASASDFGAAGAAIRFVFSYQVD